MPRCNCAGSTCGCTVKAGVGITVTGTGTKADPFIVTAVIAEIGDVLTFQDTSTINFTVVGDGVPGDPLVVTADLIRQNLPNYTTGGRPSAATWGAGAVYYDTTLGKPIFSNGAVWKDAAGTTV